MSFDVIVRSDKDPLLYHFHMLLKSLQLCGFMKVWGYDQHYLLSSTRWRSWNSWQGWQQWWKRPDHGTPSSYIVFYNNQSRHFLQGFAVIKIYQVLSSDRKRFVVFDTILRYVWNIIKVYKVVIVNLQFKRIMSHGVIIKITEPIFQGLTFSSLETGVF